ncbi:MAG: DUF5615 family PIN-like protein [Armatimonadetes bacterium]|nr:DUF5615 family PIN-like protein [Armatimonadota bacterium]
MIRLLADEDFNNTILRGLQRRIPHLDVVRVQDVGLRGAHDPVILEWAANEGRVMVSHDLSTLPPAARERVHRGLPMPGLFLVPQIITIGTAIEQLEFVAVESDEGEWSGSILYLPLR